MANVESHRAPDFIKVKSGTEALAMLGLPTNPPPGVSEVKAAYRKLALENHPDLHPGNKEKLSKFLAVSYAYELLTNPDFRGREEAATNHQDLNVQAQLSLKFEDAFFGKSLRLFFNFTETKYTEALPEGDRIMAAKLALDPIVVVVKPGTPTGTVYPFSGKGLERGSTRGDLKIVAVVMPNSQFRMDGPNVVSQLQVPLHTMLAGGEVDAPTMWGIRKLVIPPGTSPGEHLKIRRCGVSKVGDQLVEIHPKYPSRDDLRSGDWKGLDVNWDLTEQTGSVDPEMDLIRKVFLTWTA